VARRGNRDLTRRFLELELERAGADELIERDIDTWVFVCANRRLPGNHP